MLNIAWIFLFGFGCLYLIFMGRSEEIGNLIANSVDSAIKFSIGICGIVAFWCGMMNILKDSGLISKIGKMLSPIIIRLFPETKGDIEARDAIISNITANFLGLGNAATPYGISAVEKLQSHSIIEEEASKSVCLFLVINSASFQLLPTTVIAIMTNAGCENPSDIILPIWIISIISLFTAIISFKLLNLKRKV